jgi:uncharacterized protein YbaR (Trm112 family)
MSARIMTAEDLRWVVCPVCHGSLQLEPDGVRCLECGRCYPVIDGIPVLLADRTVSSPRA